MSRIGKKPVAIPAGVSVELADGELKVKGPKGLLAMHVLEDVEIKVADGQIAVKPANDTKRARSRWGMQRTLMANLVEGVTAGFARKLEVTGVGYRAAVQGKTLRLQIGLSHDVNYPIPEGIDIKCPDQTTIEISGIDKQRVGQVAAEIRAYRKPEPYKGKGIRHSGEYIYRKEGKKK